MGLAQNPNNGPVHRSMSARPIYMPPQMSTTQPVSLNPQNPSAITAVLFLSSRRLISIASFALATWARFSDGLALWIVFSNPIIDCEGFLFAVPLAADPRPPAPAAASLQHACAVPSILCRLPQVTFYPWHSHLGLIVERNGVTFCACFVLPSPCKSFAELP